MFQRNELIDQTNLVEGFAPLSQGALDTMQSLQCRAVLICLLIFPTHLCFATSPLDRLAEAVRFKTVRSQNTSEIDY